MALPPLRRRHESRPTLQRGTTLPGRAGLLMTKYANPLCRLAPRTPTLPCVQPPPVEYLIRHIHAFTVLDKRALAYKLTCFHHHRCRLMALEPRKGSPETIESRNGSPVSGGKRPRLLSCLLIEAACNDLVLIPRSRARGSSDVG